MGEEEFARVGEEELARVGCSIDSCIVVKW